jgi:hypothetical protein
MPLNGSGTARIQVVGSDDLEVSFTSAATPLGIETVAVAAGTFTNALHVRLAVTFPELLFTQTVDTWLVPGIGPVKETSSDPFTGQKTWELVSYSVPAIVRRKADFSGDGRSDILWRNSASGENYLYPMDGTTILPAEGYLRTVADLNWQVAGVGDFDGDGRADVLWRNAASGDNYLYFMNGVSIANEGYVRTVPVPDWQIKGVGDLDGDGRADIVWRNAASGENYVFLMNGTGIAGEGYLRTVADLGWQIVALGDYDGDGKTDILWRHSSTGENYLYPMDGASIKATEGYLRTVPVGNWNVVSK